ncbi:MAG: hypothetical protein E2O41_00020 [Nitrospina sp.]|nr:MAG: hypothetical protein E2O41_00020 [Nitrospina sp.]
MIDKLTDSITSTIKNISSRLISFDTPDMVTVAGLFLILGFLWVFHSIRKTSETRQRLNDLNKALSGDGSYGLGSFIKQFGEEPRSTGDTKSSGNHAPPSPHPVLNGSPPAEIKVPLLLNLESLEENEPTTPKEKKRGP